MARQVRSALSGPRRDLDIYSAEFERSVAFYRDGLGLPLATQWAGIARFDGGNGCWLTLWRATPEDAEALCLVGRAAGLRFALDDLHAALDLLGAAGAEFVRQASGELEVTLRDPDGNPVTLLERQASPSGRGSDSTRDDCEVA